MARALAAAVVASLLAVSGAGGSGVQSPKSGGTVVVVFSNVEPRCLNLVLPACKSGFAWNTLIDETLQGALEPGLHGWRNVLVSGTTLAKKPFTVTYHIRPQAHWSDGKPVVARDFVFSYQTALKYGDLDPGDPLRTEVRRFVAVDAKTLRVDYREYFVFWHSLLPRPLPRHALLGEDFSAVWDEGIDNPKTGKPIGDGPFLIQGWERGRQLVLVRNPNYWGPHLAYLKRLVFRFISDPGEVNQALPNNEVGVVGGNDSTEQGVAQELARQPPPGIKVESTPGPGWEHFDIRVRPPGNAILGNKLVRRALAYGIDRDALVRSLYSGFGPIPPVVDSTVYLPNEQEYQPNWNIYRYRPVLARQLLGQAGCRVGADGIDVCGGERLSLSFVTTAGNERRKQTLLIVQAQLRRIGIEVVPFYAPRSAFFPDVLGGGTFDVALFSWNSGPDAVSWPYGCDYPTNYTGYCSRLVTSDSNQLFQIVDPGRRAAVANRVDNRLAQDVPVIPLFQNKIFIAHRSSIHGIVPSAFNDPTWNAENWWIDH